MKVTLAEVQGLDRSLPAITRQPLPIKLSYRLAKLIGFCGRELEAMEAARTKLVEKYAGDKDEKGALRVKPENEEKFRDEFSELLSEEVDLDFSPIPLSELGDVKVTPLDLFRLSKIITEDPE